jgi:predicted Zn-dependent protease
MGRAVIRGATFAALYAAAPLVVTAPLAVMGLLVVTGPLVVMGPGPAAAQQDFLTDFILPESEARKLAEAEHPKIVAAFGGAYHDPALAKYVSSIATYLGLVSTRPDITYRITILNSPVVNAFALPAGYIYVTRGLLALADDEAQLAGVIAHEIGHVTARHTAQRYSRTILAQGILGLLGAMTEGGMMEGLSDLAEPVALIALQSYSREHENEADRLALRFMANAGYDPRGMSGFLRKMEASEALQSSLSGQGDAPAQLDLFATHPRTAERVEQTIAAATGIQVNQPMTERALYLGKIDGMLYGDDPEQGFVRGRVFAHPGLDIRFEAPPDFDLVNGQEQVTARGPQGTFMEFALAPEPWSGTMPNYLRRVWAKGVSLRNIETLNVNGFPAATATARVEQQGQAVDIRVAAIRGERGAIYRILYAAPPGLMAGLDPSFRDSIFNFRRLTQQERWRLRPYRLQVRQVRPGESYVQLASQLPFRDERLRRFRVLNGLTPTDWARPGNLVKLVVED